MSVQTDRYLAQRMLDEIGDEGQKKLLEASVLIVGCGALGSSQAQLLARAGIGHIRIVDRDVLEQHNLQRQILFDEEDVAAGLPKAEAAARYLARINSTIQVEGLIVDMTHRNVEKLISDVDVILDGTDNFETRYLLNDACVKHHKTWIYGGVIGTTGMTMTVVPGAGPCIRCILPEIPPAGHLPTCDTRGILNAVPMVISSLQVADAIRRLVDDAPSGYRLVTVDLWDGSFQSLDMHRDKHCPCCARNEYDFLSAEKMSWVTTLCGRNAVQISPPEQVALSFSELSERLRHVAKVSRAGSFIQIEGENYTILVFKDGRTIVKGTTDEAVARSLYAKYLGS